MTAPHRNSDSTGKNAIGRWRMPPEWHPHAVRRNFNAWDLPPEGVVMASFGDPAADAHAHDIVKQAFPDRHVVQLPLRGIARRGGGTHCCTQQQPAAARP